MRADRRWLWLVVGMAGVVFAGACGDGDAVKSEAGIARPSDNPAAAVAAPTPVDPPPLQPVASTPARPTATTVAPSVAAPAAAVAPEADPTPRSSYVGGIPQVTVTPTRAPIGTTVEVEGFGFLGEPWQAAGGPLWLSSTGDCGLFAPADHDLRVSADGHLVGSFVVPEQGECRFESFPGPVTIGGGDFKLAFQCTSCHIGTFTVILEGESMEEPTGTECAPINFGGGENVAAQVFADGLPCAEAESFIRANAGPWGADQGPAHVEADGFSCDRTGYSDRYMPRANYKCTRGAATIWFNRT